MCYKQISKHMTLKGGLEAKENWLQVKDLGCDKRKQRKWEMYAVNVATQVLQNAALTVACGSTKRQDTRKQKCKSEEW